MVGHRGGNIRSAHKWWNTILTGRGLQPEWVQQRNHSTRRPTQGEELPAKSGSVPNEIPKNHRSNENMTKKKGVKQTKMEKLDGVVRKLENENGWTVTDDTAKFLVGRSNVSCTLCESF